ncbi:MAG: 3-phosphoserine/phosphohydroxythreonine transaminase [Tissierellia bacterium]|nr:3-phosphoserine/phosphohydroxythreonine transaminase [Tissierellia bacterium]
MNEVYNFSAGPSCLPKAVLEKAQKDLLDYNASGMSVMEMSHRSSIYDEIHNQAAQDLKDLLGVSEDFDLLFLQGGGSSQFSMVPLNLLNPGEKAAYVVTGSWAKKAFKEAARFNPVELLASSEDTGFDHIPEINPSSCPDAKFTYVCTNNTIYGSRIVPQKLDPIETPLVADMSSNILSEVYDMTKFDLVYAGAQKNLGPAGVTLVLIKKGLKLAQREDLPTMLNYQTHLEKNSLYNTPPCFNIYICGLVAQWLKDQGGVPAMEERNKEKAKLLYEAIDNSQVFKNKIRPQDRSLMNVTFVTGDKDLDAKFIAGAKKKGLENLKGHRSTGGIRASIYNAMPLEGVKALVDYMKEFELENR